MNSITYLDYLEYIGRKYIILTMVTQGKTILLGNRELLGRRQLIQKRGG